MVSTRTKIQATKVHPMQMDEHAPRIEDVTDSETLTGGISSSTTTTRRRCTRPLEVREIVCGVILIGSVSIIIALIVLGVTCNLNNCKPPPPPDDDDDEGTIDTCGDCQFLLANLVKYTGKDSYSATGCEDPLHVTLEPNTFTVDSDAGDTSGETEGVSEARIEISLPGLANTGSNTIDLYWEADKSKRSKEFVKIVFSDTGDQYSGCGEFGSSLFKPKPSGTDDYKSYVLWAEEDNPIYLPYYVARNEFASFCMFLDAEGAPVDITVRATETEWVIYQTDNVYFHIYSGTTPYEALKKCSAKWKELYLSPDASWTDDFILGSLTPGEMKTASETANIFATHYVMSSASFYLESDQIAVPVTNVAEEYDKYETVFFPWEANLNLKSDSGFTRTTEDGFYESGAADSDSYILDYGNSAAKTAITTAVFKTKYAGLMLRDGVLASESGKVCPAYLNCSGLQLTTSHYRDSSVLCPGTDFGDEPMFQRHNTYDASRRAALQYDGTMVIESVATPGTTHFYRDVELTADGLKTCYNNILNLHLVGVRAVTCNMCGGFIGTLQNAAPLAPELKSLCFKYSQLSLLMPYIVMYDKDKSPPLLADDTDASLGVDMKPTLDLRRRLKYYLDAAYRTAITNNEPFVYTLSAMYNDEKYRGQYEGAVIGDSLFMVVKIEESGDFSVVLPSGSWYSNPQVSEFGTYKSGSITEYNEDITSLLYFKIGSIFVMRSLDDPNHVHVQIFQSYSASDTISHDFEYYEPGTQVKHVTKIVFDPTNENVKFTYTSPGSTVTQDITISKIEVYLWHVAEAKSRNWIVYHPLTVDSNIGPRFNVVFDYLNDGFTSAHHSIFETWTESITNPGGA